MERVYTKDLHEYIDREVLIAGWVDVRRDHGKLIFIDLRDSTGKVQLVALPDKADAHKLADTVRSEWVIEVMGKVNKRPERMVNPEVDNGDIEIEITSVIVLAEADEMPFEAGGELNLDTYLDHLPLTLRTERARAIFKIQALIIQSFRKFLVQERFIEFQAPSIIGEDAEGGAEVFDVKYFDNTAHLATSPQLYKQILVGVYERVFTTGNVFRAEKHSTSRHINEYTSLDIEMGFINDHHDVMNLTGQLMQHMVSEVEKRGEKELKLFDQDKVRIGKEIPYIKLRDAQKFIKKEHGEDCEEEHDLSPQHERWISEFAFKKYDSDFIFVTHFPIEKRPMYTYEDENDPGYTKSFDLLFRGIEVNTGSQRVHNYATLVKNIKRKGLDPEKFSFYLQAFKYGMPPHGGFGMGLERLTAKFLGLLNIKEATLFPREINRIDTLLRE